jgi:quinate dehydrogenase (quinone)
MLSLGVAASFSRPCRAQHVSHAGTAEEIEWRSYGHDPGGMRFSPLDQINRTDVERLQRVWTFHTGELTPEMRKKGQPSIPSFEATPVMADGVLYFSTIGERVIALDAETGKQIWEFDSQAGKNEREFMQSRGLAYWEGASSAEGSGDGPASQDRRIFVGFRDKLYALDARTGKLCPGFGRDGVINLRDGVGERWPQQDYSVTSPPVVYKNLVITGAQLQEYPSLGPSGDIRAWDARSGALVWTFHTVARPGETGHDTWEDDAWRDRSGTNVWAMMTVDVARGMVFLPIGSPSYDFYGADRKGPGLFGNSLVALDAQTGKLLWYYQMVHHDLWDYDLPAAPALVTVRRAGREIPAVAQVTKMGFVFVLDRLTGKPLFPVEERPVPASTVPGEVAWPTQPFPLKPPPLSPIALTASDITTVTPESRQYCLKEFGPLLPEDGTINIFNPEGLTLTLMTPGTLGGGTWSGASFDPSTGYLYVNANNAPAVGMMKPQPPGSPEAYQRTSHWGSYARYWDSNHYPCVKPPWGTLNAIDLATGEIAWRVPLGVFDELAARGIPATGTPNLGGSIVTAGGLVFIAGSSDRRFRAFDARTGKVLWETYLEASGHATPMTFLGKKTGKQFVVVAAGGGGYFSTTVSDTLDAYALP